MKDCFNQKQPSFLPRLIFATAFVLGAISGYGQTTVDCSVSGNCANAYCNYPANIEKGCRCFDGIDNDGDGKIDKADSNCATYYGLVFVGEGSNCSIVPPGNADPFDLVNVPITSAQNTADTQSKVSVGDVDGDGIPDAVITSKWNSEIRVVATRTPQADGTAAGKVKSDFNLSGAAANALFSDAPNSGDCKPNRLLFEHENLIADIDKDGKAEIYGVVSNRGGNPQTPPTCFYLVGFKYGPGAGGLMPLFNAVSIGTDRPGTFGIADMDGDGKAEIYLRDRIYAAETGALLAAANGDWDLDVTSAPVAVNISGDTKMELVCGTKIYSIPSLTSRNPATPGALTLLHDMNTIGTDDCYVKLMLDLVEYGEDTHSSCSVADIDRDGNVDVVISGALNDVHGKTAVFYWNVVKNTVSHFIPPDADNVNGWEWGTGRVNLGDANGDGRTDFSFISGDRLWCLTTDPSGNLVPLWANFRTINDSRSGVLTVTIYDFNNDGQPEMVYRDSQILAVIDGATGTTLKWSAVCQSHTYTEGPIIADVNGDGGTDICVTCNTSNSFDIDDGLQQQALGQFRLYYSSANDWLPTRKVWNQPGYFVVNIKDNLQLPFPQLDQTLIFGTSNCPNGLPGPQMPMNVFLNQVPYLSAEGCPVFPAPDLSYTGDNPDTPGIDSNGDGSYAPTVEVIPPICGDLGIKVRFNIINDGDLPITANIPVSFFKADPTAPTATASDLLYTTTVNVTNLQVDQTLTTPFVNFNGTGGTFRLYIVLNNNGSILPINLSAPSTLECRIDNNLYSVNIVPDPFITKIEKIKDNFKCINSGPNTGEVRVRIFKGAVEQTDYSPYGFQWYTGPATSPVIINGATNYNLTGLAEGDYSALVRNVVKGCVGVLVDTTIIRTGVDPDVTIVATDQTLCNPPNGTLTATVTGGNTGYTFRWYDIGLNYLGITGANAVNMTAGNYKLIVDKDGCTKQFDAPPILAPAIPDAQAQVLQHVVDCINANSGSISADAVFSGQIQNPGNYTFNWFFYNNVTSTKGSILPAMYGSGPVRTGLPVGYYTVEVTDNTTQCKSNQTPVVQIMSQTILPTVSIAEVLKVTSCDPTKPNGVLTATAVGTGLISPTDFTFEWFKGDNTLAVNKVTTVAGLRGETVTQVPGGGVYYTVKATTANNCSATEKFIIGEDINVPVLTLAVTPNSICDPANAATSYNGTVTATVTFKGNPVTLPDPNYQFTWHNGSLTTDPQIAVTDNKARVLAQLNGGNYTAVVERTDLHCPSIPVTKTVLNAIVLPLIDTDSIPSTNCVVTYNGNPISNGQVSVFEIDNAAPTANYSFLWSDNASPTDVDGKTTSIVTAVQGGFIYTVQVTNKLTGCKNTHNVALPDASVVPVVSLTVLQPNGICDPVIASTPYNGRISAGFLTPSGSAADYKYIWRNVTNNAALGNTPPAHAGLLVNQFGGLNGGKTYSVVAENTVLGCTSGVSQVFLPNNLILPKIETDSIASTNCVILYNGNTISNGEASIFTVDSKTPGTAGAITNVDYSYSWSSNAVAPAPAVIGQTGTSILNIQGGFIYTVEVTNKHTGCKNTDPVPLADASVIPVVSLDVLQPNGICDPVVANTPFNGKIETSFITPSGNAADYKYTWRNVTGNAALGDTPPAQAGLLFTQFGGLDGNKTYSVVAENKILGCTSGATQVFLPNALVLPVIETDSVPGTNCVPVYLGIPKSNGEVSVSDIDNGKPFTDYNILWSDDGVTPTPTASTATVVQNLEAGFQYTVKVTTKATGCVNSHTVILTDNQKKPLVNVTKNKDNINCTGTPTGELQVVVTYNGVQKNNPGITPLPSNYKLTWSNAATTDIISSLAATTYTVTVVDEDLGCTSDPDSKPILNTLDYPAITIPAPTDQTSCNAATPNGAVQATVTGGPALSTFQHTWRAGVGTGGAIISNATGLISGTVTPLTNRLSGDYTIIATNQGTGCESIQSAFIPNNITYPTIAFSSVIPVSNCNTPNGSVTATLTNESLDYTIFYLKASEGDPSIIKSTATNIFDDVNPVYGSLKPGYVSAVVRNNTTQCDSNPITAQIIDNTTKSTINFTLIPVPGVLWRRIRRNRCYRWPSGSSSLHV
jgi:hypothetical protein